MNTKNNRTKLMCPYCGSEAVLRQGNFVFGANAVISHLWVCSNYPKCDSYVSAHAHNKKPQGNLANKILREKRRETHIYLDRIWRKGIMTRKETYNWMRFVLGITQEESHIAMLTLEQCNELIEKSKKTLKTSNLKKSLQDRRNS